MQPLTQSIPSDNTIRNRKWFLVGISIADNTTTGIRNQVPLIASVGTSQDVIQEVRMKTLVVALLDVRINQL